MANSKIPSFNEYIEETTLRGPIVTTDPLTDGGNPHGTGRAIYLSARDFASKHVGVLKSDVRPVSFDAREWINAPKGTVLDARPEFMINSQLVATLAWVPPRRKMDSDTGTWQSGKSTGHWKLQSMHIPRD